MVTGWGQDISHDVDSTTDRLRKVGVPWVSDKYCKKNYEKKGIKITPRMMCSGDVEKGTVDACQGDSGGKVLRLDPEDPQ